MINKDEDKIIDEAAAILAGGHSTMAEEMLRGAIHEVQFHHHGAGARAHANWVASLEMLGTVCMAIAKMERSKVKGL